MQWRWSQTVAVVGAALLGTTLLAQGAPVPTGVGDEFSAAFMTEHLPALFEKARTTPDGTATLVMHRYDGNYLNLMVRVKTGIGEMHAGWSDILVCIDGEADIITGGTLVDRKDMPGGESRGTRSEGGVHHLLHKGDFIHIQPNTPHWTVLEPGKTFAFWAVKIESRPAAPPAAQAPSAQPH